MSAYYGPWNKWVSIALTVVHETNVLDTDAIFHCESEACLKA